MSGPALCRVSYPFVSIVVTDRQTIAHGNKGPNLVDLRVRGGLESEGRRDRNGKHPLHVEVRNNKREAALHFARCAGFVRRHICCHGLHLAAKNRLAGLLRLRGLGSIAMHPLFT